MNVMTKRGTQDNVITYEHYCDTKNDLTAIPNDQITLGSTAVVLKDEGDAMGVYMANSSKEWIPFSSVGNAGGGSGGGGSTGGPVVVHTTHDKENEAYILDHTWQEINDALDSGKMVIVQNKVVDGDSFSQIKQQIIYNTTFDMKSPESQRYWCSIFDYESMLYDTFYCPTANDYPSIDDGSGGPG